jgi:hypothetical protein
MRKRLPAPGNYWRIWVAIPPFLMRVWCVQLPDRPTPPPTHGSVVLVDGGVAAVPATHRHYAIHHTRRLVPGDLLAAGVPRQRMPNHKVSSIGGRLMGNPTGTSDILILSALLSWTKWYNLTSILDNLPSCSCNERKWRNATSVRMSDIGLLLPNLGATLDTLKAGSCSLVRRSQ